MSSLTLATPARAMRPPHGSRLGILLNANAKRVTPGLIRSLERRYGSGPIFVSHDLDEARRHCRALAKLDVVAVGGGDGSVAHAMNMLAAEAARAGRELPAIGVLRLGTGNALGYVTGAGAAADDLDAWLRPGGVPTTRISLVEDAESGFRFPFASVGYDARLLNDYLDLSGNTTHALGRAFMRSLGGYMVAAATRTIPGELRTGAGHARVRAVGPAAFIDREADEEVALDDGAVLFEGPARAVSLGTIPFYGYGIRVLPFANRRLDRFQVRVSTAAATTLLRKLPQLWRGSLRSPEIHDFLVREVEVDLEQDQPFQMAGEANGRRSTFRWRLAERSFDLLLGSRHRAARNPRPLFAR